MDKFLSDGLDFFERDKHFGPFTEIILNYNDAFIAIICFWEGPGDVESYALPRHSQVV